MLIYFIVISLLIHIFTILALVILYQRSTIKGSHGLPLAEDMETLEQQIEGYISEIERENEAFYEKINQLFAEKLQALEIKLDQLEKRIESLDQDVLSEVAEAGTPAENGKTEEVGEVSLPNRQRVLELYRQGLNVEEISRTLQIGKGEVSLLLNLIEHQAEKN